jgi:hypothetical protein
MLLRSGLGFHYLQVRLFRLLLLASAVVLRLLPVRVPRLDVQLQHPASRQPGGYDRH